MTFSFTINRRLLIGDCKMIFGTFTNDGGSIGGAIPTELRTIENFTLTYIKSVVVADSPTINGSLTAIGTKKVIELSAPAGFVPIVTPADTSGFWCVCGT
jgi:hypothetical protein